MGVLVMWVRESVQTAMRNPAPEGRDHVGDVLAEWFEYESSYRPKLGIEGRSRYRASRQWDEADLDYAVDDELLAARARAVSECIERLEPRMRAAIYAEMRNRSSDADVRVRNVTVGAAVFRNARFTEVSRSDFEMAIAKLAPMLAAKGLVDKTLDCASNPA
ncbi:hypothetical protein [Burkholderia vietnamiensis]|uniref:hypothetical protein n=1 Tax=Burkholderia vietnamiensis TaxID=60552 RepID=UPI002DD41DC0|nr:hypothetical protein [Burkholderia vietnamiensis]MEC4595474.1 hypothetical protein [Burkholderia vietnamiensis]